MSRARVEAVRREREPEGVQARGDGVLLAEARAMSERCREGQISVKGKCRDKEKVSVQELAHDYHSYFEWKKRDSGKEFWATTSDRPKELENLIHKAHTEMMPDDYKYEYIENSLDIIESAERDEDLEEPYDQLEHDVYTRDLIEWLRSNLDRTYYADEVLKEYGGSVDGIIQVLGAAQQREKEEVYFEVLRGLRDILGHE